jgi:hypothetical protein
MKSPAGYEIEFIFLANVPPFDKEAHTHELRTAAVRKESATTEYLLKIFDTALNDAKIEITFTSNEKQENPVRTELLKLAESNNLNSKIAVGKRLARQLHNVTDDRSGLGLFCIIQGRKGGTTRLVLIRFKAEEGLANKRHGGLVDYIEEVFTKRSNHYKLVVYDDVVSKKSFWKGFSLDKQLSASTFKPVSLFWVESFLQSQAALTPAQGTMQFSKIIKTILSSAKTIDEQEQIISGIVNLKHKRNAQTSVADFCKTYLSPELSARVQADTSNDDFFNSVFAVDHEVFKKELGKTVISLKEGITAFVPTFQYEKNVTETTNADGSKTIKIEGKLESKKINVKQSKKKG